MSAVETAKQVKETTMNHEASVQVSGVPPLEALRECVLNIKEPIGKRTRGVFYLRSLNSKEALDVLLLALQNKDDSELMRHEIAYVIGQMGMEEASDVLIKIIEDLSDDCMVRHEAAEALGNVGTETSLPVLEKFSNDEAVEVAETCQLALQLIKWKQAQKNDESKDGETDRNPYLSVDPAPADEVTKSVDELKKTLLDSSLPLFQRYRAMFSLRNRNTEDAALALGEAFDDKSALFRHEIAYVMGQMENPATVPSLKKVLTKHSEHRMVRHEAAEALGAIGSTECEKILDEYKKDNQQVVRESCEVALDIIDYWAVPSTQ